MLMRLYSGQGNRQLYGLRKESIKLLKPRKIQDNSDIEDFNLILTLNHELNSHYTSTKEQTRLSEKLKGLMQVHTQYVGNLLCTKHQGDYYKFVMDNLQPSEAVIIVDYKMKLELGV
ncbi:hypothetical protein OS493_033209 [Desmophyllum pertusum]|uniref:Uncharacterized protein n=1 Tax=Desmophyllum pertusum TaxID=174260 RepID=A0A9W9Y8D9_9CNID|nr:hypothetical protein OS493_033209 [Desmophyllum pertusum]